MNCWFLCLHVSVRLIKMAELASRLNRLLATVSAAGTKRSKQIVSNPSEIASNVISAFINEQRAKMHMQPLSLASAKKLGKLTLLQALRIIQKKRAARNMVQRGPTGPRMMQTDTMRRRNEETRKRKQRAESDAESSEVSTAPKRLKSLDQLIFEQDMVSEEDEGMAGSLPYELGLIIADNLSVADLASWVAAFGISQPDFERLAYRKYKRPRRYLPYIEEEEYQLDSAKNDILRLTDLVVDGEVVKMASYFAHPMGPVTFDLDDFRRRECFYMGIANAWCGLSTVEPLNEFYKDVYTSDKFLEHTERRMDFVNEARHVRGETLADPSFPVDESDKTIIEEIANTTCFTSTFSWDDDAPESPFGSRPEGFTLLPDIEHSPLLRDSADAIMQFHVRVWALLSVFLKYARIRQFTIDEFAGFDDDDTRSLLDFSFALERVLSDAADQNFGIFDGPEKATFLYKINEVLQQEFATMADYMDEKLKELFQDITPYLESLSVIERVPVSEGAMELEPLFRSEFVTGYYNLTATHVTGSMAKALLKLLKSRQLSPRLFADADDAVSFVNTVVEEELLQSWVESLLSRDFHISQLRRYAFRVFPEYIKDLVELEQALSKYDWKPHYPQVRSGDRGVVQAELVEDYSQTLASSDAERVITKAYILLELCKNLDPEQVHGIFEQVVDPRVYILPTVCIWETSLSVMASLILLDMFRVFGISAGLLLSSLRQIDAPVE